MKKRSLLPTKSALNLMIYYHGTDLEKETIAKTIHNYYENHLAHYLTLDRFDDIKRFFLFMIGLLFIIFSRLIHWPILSELLLISGWVAVWEMFYDVLFGEMKRKIEVRRYRTLTHSKIIFQSSENKQIDNESVK